MRNNNNNLLNIYYVLAVASIAYFLGSFFSTPQIENTYHLSRFFNYLIFTPLGIYLFLLVPSIILVVSAIRVKKSKGKFYKSLDFYIGAISTALLILAVVMVYAFVHLH